MKTKDLVYVGIIAFLGYLLLKKKSLTQLAQDKAPTSTVPVGNSTNGGLNLGENMDLPNLTATSPNGMSTEVALNSSNVTPLVKDDNEPTQVFGSYNLPTPYGVSVINPNPIDVVPVTATNMPVASTTPYPNASTTPYPTASTIEFETVGTTPIPVTTSTTTANTPRPTVTPALEVVEQEPPTVFNTPRPKLIVPEPVKDELISQCGNSFSIPNNDKEGSYTNYWFDGENYFMQTTSPLMRTIANKISKDQFFDGCKKLQSYNIQNNKS